MFCAVKYFILSRSSAAVCGFSRGSADISGHMKKNNRRPALCRLTVRIHILASVFDSCFIRRITTMYITTTNTIKIIVERVLPIMAQAS